MKKIIAAAILGATAFLTGCQKDADVASRNLSQDADNFRIARRIVFVNGITGEYMLELRGLCSIGNYDKRRELTVTCKTPDGYKKHFLGLSDNVTYFAEQLDATYASTQHYQVTFKPSTIIPSIELR